MNINLRFIFLSLMPSPVFDSEMWLTQFTFYDSRLLPNPGSR